MIHKLKTLPKYFDRTWDLEKNFEIRRNDREFQTGDKLILKEWNGRLYTGREITCTIIYILYDFEGLADGYVALSLEINSCLS